MRGHLPKLGCQNPDVNIKGERENNWFLFSPKTWPTPRFSSLGIVLQTTDLNCKCQKMSIRAEHINDSVCTFSILNFCKFDFYRVLTFAEFQVEGGDIPFILERDHRLTKRLPPQTPTDVFSTNRMFLPTCIAANY